MTKIGFLGLGKIGMPIARHLIAAGHEVLGYRRGDIATFVALGGVAAGSPAEVGAADVVFLCLPGKAALEEVIDGPDGLMSTAKPGQVIACLGSCPVPAKQAFADAFAKKGTVFLDGEVSGSPGMVEGRKAAIYLSGDEAASEGIRPLVEAFTETCLYLGAFGSATRIKLLNNVLVALDIAGTAQVMAIGLHGGVDPERLIEAVKRGSGSSVQFGLRAPWMAERRFTPQQGAAQALHYYVSQCREMAVDAGVSTRLIDELIDIYSRALPIVGDRDAAAILELFETPAKMPRS